MMTSRQTAARQAVLTTAHRDHEKGLRTRAFFKVRDQNVGHDLVQDTFMKTWIYMAKGGKIDAMKAFLYHILNNLIVDEYRKHKAASLDTLIENGFEPSADQDQLGQVFNMLDGEIALRLIERLPAIYQEVMRMRYMQNLSLKEMSAITGQSKSTIAVQVHRGLEKLKILYEPLVSPIARAF